MCHILPDNNAASASVRPVPWRHVCALLAGFVTVAGFLAPNASNAQQADGERSFRQRCGACHSIEGGQNRAGPPLSGVIGRIAGTIEGARYSVAMRNSGIVWDSRSLDSFLAALRQTVAGTTMTVSVPDPTQRAAIIAYLESQ